MIAVVVAQGAGAHGLTQFMTALASGIALGAIYATLALGFVIIFKATQVVNFAHGAIASLGAYFVVYFAVTANFPGGLVDFLPRWMQWILSVVAALVAAGVLGIVIERITIRPMIGEPLFAVAMITLGLDLIVRTVTNDYLSNQVLGLGDPWGARTLTVGGVVISYTQVITVLVSVAAMLLLAAFFRSRMGIAMRATALDQEAALAQGISVGRVFATAWAIGAALAALGGIFTSVFPRAAGVSPFTAFFAFRAFPAVVIGGLDSIVGAIVGGMLVGMVEVFAGTYLTQSWLGAGFSGIVGWLFMMVVLLVKPYGLFGTEEIRRV
jgi:branched-chain amino acid transport system permease protein